jgi:tRNA/rRNA methyltransferase
MMEVIFILVEPAVAGNVGSAARAIKTMGFSQLRLVNPCDYLSLEARKMAHASGEILENAEVFYGLKEALEDIDLSIATTAKQRDARLEFHPNTDIPEIIRSKGDTIKNVAIVFGGEESGLSNNDIRTCDIASTIPLIRSYPSLNLGQAVMLYAYTLRSSFPGRENGKDDKKINPDEFRTMMDKSKDFLGIIEVDRNPALYNRVLERIALLNEDDIHLVLSILGRLK